MLIKRRKHSVPILNTTATADISFMLLTFFLVTTSMDVDSGLVRQLPPADSDRQQQQPAAEVSRDNTISFNITADNRIVLDGKPVEVKALRQKIVAFVSSRPESHIIYIDADPTASYDAYFQLQNEIVAAYRTVRDGLARRRYHRPYDCCAEWQREAIRSICPQRIAETYNEGMQPENAAQTEKGGRQ